MREHTYTWLRDDINKDLFGVCLQFVYVGDLGYVMGVMLLGDGTLTLVEYHRLKLVRKGIA